MRIIIALLFSFLFMQANGQQKWFVRFTDKDDSFFTQEISLSEKAVEKGTTAGMDGVDYYDLPVKQAYLDYLTRQGFEITSVSNWLNGVFVTSDQKRIHTLHQLAWVGSITQCHFRAKITSFDVAENDQNELDELMKAQIDEFNGQQFIENGIDGTGITIAIFDGGFPGVDRYPEFEHLRTENRILATYDFVKKKEFVYDYNTHGTMVLSCIAGKKGNENMGLATGARFLLARTEQNSEPFSEEENWLAAVEWAAAHGANIINSSLGYTYHRYFPDQMDGHTSLVSEAARIAARKGILVVNAMGNDGNNNWHFVGTPADVDSVLSVGGINPSTGYHIYFSSYGPSYDMAMKPNVAAFGEAVTRNKSKAGTAFGTSFSSPLVAGFAACVWQMNPGMNNMEVFRLIEQSGELYPYYDYAHGYGIPKADYFFEKSDTLQTGFELQITDYTVDVYVPDTIREEAPGNLLYWHIEKPDGVLRRFQVVKVTRSRPLIVSKEELNAGETLRIYYNRTIKEYKK